MRELIDKFRGYAAFTKKTKLVNRDVEDCADELEAWLNSLWTQADTARAETWPSFGQHVVRSNSWFTTDGIYPEVPIVIHGDWWRPRIEGIDTPPKKD